MTVLVVVVDDEGKGRWNEGGEGEGEFNSSTGG